MLHERRAYWRSELAEVFSNESEYSEAGGKDLRYMTSQLKPLSRRVIPCGTRSVTHSKTRDKQNSSRLSDRALEYGNFRAIPGRDGGVGVNNDRNGLVDFCARYGASVLNIAIRLSTASTLDSYRSVISRARRPKPRFFRPLHNHLRFPTFVTTRRAGLIARPEPSRR